MMRRENLILKVKRCLSQEDECRNVAVRGLLNSGRLEPR